MKKVFICHSSKDKKLIRKLADALEQHGVRVWLDEREILVGDPLRETIELGLSDADYVIVALSKTALKSTWVRKELSAAFAIENERDSKVILSDYFIVIKLVFGRLLGYSGTRHSTLR